MLDFVKADRIWLRDTTAFSEKWVQNIIASDPSVLGLGDLDLRDQERMQPRAGRLDLLLQDPDSKRRYEVELQLGSLDESHIIRSIEYWDIERKRYPQYDHCAVLIAEDITARFLNVVSLFNGFIPLIALQMQAVRVGAHVTLVFTKVLDEMTLGFDDTDDARTSIQVDRSFWEAKATSETVALADDLLSIAQEFAPDLALRFTKHYVGMSQSGQAFNFIAFRPKKSQINLELRLPHSTHRDEMMSDAGLGIISYNDRHGLYTLKLTKADIETKRSALRTIIQDAYRRRVD